MPTPARRRAGAVGLVGATLLGAILLAAGLLAACSSGGPATPTAATLADRHAHTAGTVMTRDAYPLRAIDAAALVAGRAGDTGIDVLQAGGTTRGGQVTLRITVDRTTSGGPTDRVQQCFEYRFGRAVGSGAEPIRVDPCPAGSPLAVPSTPPPPLTTATRQAVRAALTALPPARRIDAATVRAALERALGPRLLVTAGGTAATVDAEVTSGDQCVTARSSATAVTVGPLAHGTDCRGG